MTAYEKVPNWAGVRLPELFWREGQSSLGPLGEAQAKWVGGESAAGYRWAGAGTQRVSLRGTGVQRVESGVDSGVVQSVSAGQM